MRGDQGREPPAILVHRAVAGDLEVLLGMSLGGVRVCEGVAEAHAVHRLLLDAVDMRRLRNAGDVQDGRADIDAVRELGAQPSLRR